MARSFKIALIGGDGTGPEVVAEAVKVLNAAAGKHGVKLEYTPIAWGGEHYKRTGVILPDDGCDTLRKFDAILLGAIGHPDVKPGILEKGILLALRFGLDQYINLRPVKLYPGVETPLKDKGPEDIDFVVVRENTEGLYAGAGGILKKGTPDEVAIQESINTRKGVERCIRYAFEYCRKRNKQEQAHPLRQDQRPDLCLRPLGARLPRGGAKDYPDIKTRLRPRGRHHHVDGQEPGVVRRDRDRQHVRRHHHRPGRDDPGRHGHRGRRQHQPRRASRCSSRSAAPRPSTPART